MRANRAEPSPEAIELDIDGLGSGGEGVGRMADGRVVFVPGGLPGDRVRARLGREKKRVQYAELLSLASPSPDRVESRCGVEACGGCALRALSPSRQGTLKRARVIDNLRRIGHLDVEALVTPIRQSGDGWGYRHRAKLHARYDRGWRLGYHGRQSHDLVPFEHCPVLWPELEQAVQHLCEALQPLPEAAAIDTVDVVFSRRDARAAARLVLRGDLEALRRDFGWFARSGLSAVALTGKDASFRFGNLELRYDHAQLDAFDLRYEPGVFTQAFPEANDRLVESVTRLVRPAEHPRLLELHAGIGNLTVPLGRAGARPVAVEVEPRAVILCRRNLAAAGVESAVHQLTDAQALEPGGPGADLSQFDVLLLDPPRTGAKETVERAAAQGPKRVIYVSCDSATLARDAAILGAGGYRATLVEVHDFFPETPHVETLMAFERSPPGEQPVGPPAGM